MILDGNESAPAVLLAVYVPPLLVACWATSRSLRTATTGRGGARS